VHNGDTDIGDKPTLCPNCNRPMRLASIAARVGLPDVLTFDCNCCRVGLTRAEAAVGADQPGAPRARRSAQGK
jgi:hypothetical protein